MSIEKDKLHSVISFKEEEIGTGTVLTTFLSPNGKEVKITNDVDEAMKIAMHSTNHIIDAATDRRILWKTDLYLMPLMCFLYCCQFMDKTTNSYSAIMGLRTELDMVGDMYAWTGTAFYFGYLISEFPSVFALQRFPVAKTVGIFVVLWGMILALHSVPKYAGFVALRVILGMLESGVTPAFVIITGQWYRKDEQFLRTSIWFAFNGLGSIFGGSIAYGLAIHADSYAMEAWKLVFIITGCITILCGFLILIHIPDSPMNAWFLTEEEKMLVVERIRSNQQGFGNKHFKWYQFVEAFTDIQVWLLALFAISSQIPNGGLTNFASILLSEDFGYSTLDTLLMGLPQGAVELIGCPIFGFLSVLITWKFFSHRMFWAVSVTAIVLMGSCMLAFAEGTKARLSGLYLFGLSPVGFICLLSCVSSNIAGHTKKVTSNALYLVFYCVGNIIGPQTFISTQAPDYNGAKVAIVVCYVVSLLTLCAIYFVYWKRNRDREGIDQSDIDKIENSEFADLTDMENPRFKYAL